MPDNSNCNMIMFVVLAGLILVLYQVFVIGPQQQKQKAADAVAAAQAKLAPKTPGAPGAPGVAPAAVKMTREQAIATSPRVAIATPTLAGSISLMGARF